MLEDKHERYEISDERGRMKSEHTKDAESKEANRAAAEVTTIKILRKKRGNGNDN